MYVKPRSKRIWSAYLQTLQTFSAYAVVILIPTISKDLNILEIRQQWVVSAFSLTLGCFLVCVKLVLHLPYHSPVPGLQDGGSGKQPDTTAIWKSASEH
jgi:hypothetical protein